MLNYGMQVTADKRQGWINLVEELEKLRKAHRLSVPEMADRVGITYQGMRKILMGETERIHSKTLRQISEAFDVYIREIGDRIYFVEQPQDMPRISNKTIQDAELLQQLPPADYAWIMDYIKRKVS